MNEKYVGADLGCIAASVLWVLSVGFWVTSVFYDHRPIATLALMMCGAAVTATVRCYMVTLNSRFRSAMAVTAIIDPDGVTPLVRR